MADYAGAVAAIRERLVANWTTTPIAFQNETFDPPTEPNSGAPSPWVFLEVIGNTSALNAVGAGSTQEWLYLGHILVHVFVPVNSGIAIAQQYAATIAEIFRAVQFYDATAGHAVRTGYGGEGPRTDGGGTDADDGNWFRVTMMCPFEYYFRG